MMASKEEVIKRLEESKPPTTDSFTYLTIIEESLSEDILPTLEDILEDADLTRDIGWDLVSMLIALPNSENCLERIAKLGNPREVILKVLEAIEELIVKDGEEQDAEEEDEAEDSKREELAAARSHKFVTLCGMLGVLHDRLKAKSPSRFLHTTLETVYEAYDPNDDQSTAAVTALIGSLSGEKRPPLPTRQSSTTLATPFQEGQPATAAAKDPEADNENDVPDESEKKKTKRLLQSFLTLVFEKYANTQKLNWTWRLVEYLFPLKLVPRQGTAMNAHGVVPVLETRDALAGHLAAAAGLLGLTKLSTAEVKAFIEAPVVLNPLAVNVDQEGEVTLSTTGFICLMGYIVFASTVFDAHYQQPDLHIFPDHHALLKRILGTEPQQVIHANPGTIDALVTLGVWMQAEDRIGGETAKDGDEKRTATDKTTDSSLYMQYIHLVTLIAVFHNYRHTRSAASNLAGAILHADPNENDRFAILEDLLENCVFASLQAQAIEWLREEMIAAAKSSDASKSRFASPDCIDSLQYILFPDLTHLGSSDVETLAGHWAENRPFYLKAANFGYFLMAGAYKELVPAAMGASVEERYVAPLMSMADKLLKEGPDASGLEPDAMQDLEVLKVALESIPFQ